MRIFVSYAHEQERLAETLAVRLQADGHDVFHDSSLPKGRPFDGRISKKIRACDVFLFLLSPDSVRKGSYARTELKWAQERFPNPSGRVLPVTVVETPIEDVPAYLASVTILKPEGDLVAEVVDCLKTWQIGDDETRGWRLPWLRARAAVRAGALVAGLLVAGYGVNKLIQRPVLTCPAAARASVQELLRRAQVGALPGPDDTGPLVAGGAPALACVLGEVGGDLEADDDTGQVRDVAFRLVRAFPGQQDGLCDWLVGVLRDRRQPSPRHAWATHVEAARELRDPQRGCPGGAAALGDYERDLDALIERKNDAFDTFKRWYRQKPEPTPAAFDQLRIAVGGKLAAGKAAGGGNISRTRKNGE